MEPLSVTCVALLCLLLPWPWWSRGDQPLISRWLGPSPQVQRIVWTLLWLLLLVWVVTFGLEYARMFYLSASRPRSIRQQPGWNFEPMLKAQELLIIWPIRSIKVLFWLVFGIVLFKWRPRLDGFRKERWLVASFVLLALVGSIVAYLHISWDKYWGILGIRSGGYWELYKCYVNHEYKSFRSSAGYLVDQEPFRDALKNLRYLEGIVSVDLSSSKLNDDDLVNLAMLPSVENICIDNNPITAQGIKHLRSLSKLRMVSLTSIQFVTVHALGSSDGAAWPAKWASTAVTR